MQAVSVVHETPESALPVAPLGAGVDWIDQVAAKAESGAALAVANDSTPATMALATRIAGLFITARTGRIPDDLARIVREAFMISAPIAC